MGLKDRFIATPIPSPNSSLAPFERSTNYLIASYRVDNYTGEWIQVSPDSVIIPPWTIGFVVNCFVQSQRFIVKALPQPFTPYDPSAVFGTATFPSIILVSLFDAPIPEGAPVSIPIPSLRGFNYTTGYTPDALDFSSYPVQASLFEPSVSFPMYWTGGNGNGPRNQQARGIAQMGSNSVLCAAGVWTTIKAESVALDRIAFITLSTDVAGQVNFRSDNDIWFGVGYITVWLASGIPVVIPMPGNLYQGGGSAAYNLQVRHSNGGNVGWSLGLGSTH